MMIVGLDVHQHVCFGTVMDEKGRVTEQARFTNDPEGLEEFMEGFDEAQVAMEAVDQILPILDTLDWQIAARSRDLKQM